MLLTILPQSSIPTVSAAPVAPHVFFGTAQTTVGDALSSGLNIEARINNVHYGQSVNAQTQGATSDTQTHSTTSLGYNYGASVSFQVCSDDPASTAVEGGTTGASIFFYVAGIQAQVQRLGVDSSPLASFPFQSGSANGNVAVSLIIPSLSAPTAKG